MPAHIDEPSPTQPVDPWCFLVHGWIWLGTEQGKIAAIEAWIDDRQLGETSNLYPRTDVAAAQGIDAAARTGFLINGCRFPERHGGTAGVHIRARRHDGTRSEPIASTRAIFAGGRRSPLGALLENLAPTARGLEIGAHSNPVPGLSPYFTDSVAVFAGSSGRADFLADAVALPVPDDTLDYLCSSHVLEHLPNPLGAIWEWHRVLRPGGWLYLVVPDKRYTFDAGRPVTPPRHLVEDFFNATTAADSADHIDDFIFHADWKRLRPGCPPQDEAKQREEAHAHYLEQLHREQRVDIHFHTFTPRSLRLAMWLAGLIECDAAPFRVAAQAEKYPGDRRDGIGMLLQKAGRPQARGAMNTHLVRHENAAVEALPVVCPVTLMPLQLAGDGTERALVTKDRARRYEYSAGLPNLIPPVGAAICRRWQRRPWRWFNRVASLGRLTVAPRD
ncbi:MAG: class I SAM-dependent methyltransferase [Opitutaceae bacterium]|nr:class I SAM-dependent methyltransferase [Opitutaceae bacterium]